MKTALFVVLAAALGAGAFRAPAQQPSPKPDEAEKLAQEAKQRASGQGPAIRVFTVKPGNLDRVFGAVRMIAGEHSVSADPESSTLVVRTNQDLMPAIEQVVRQLDAAAASSKNVDLTFYILQGSREPRTDAGALPAELQSTISQLKAVFAFQSFRLLDTALVRGRDGRDLSISGQLAMMGSPYQQYQLRLRPSLPADAKPPVIRIDRLRYSNGSPGASVSFEAEMDIREGQKVVIGKAGIDNNQNALILVATGRIVE